MKDIKIPNTDHSNTLIVENEELKKENRELTLTIKKLLYLDGQSLDNDRIEHALRTVARIKDVPDYFVKDSAEIFKNAYSGLNTWRDLSGDEKARIVGFVDTDDEAKVSKTPTYDIRHMYPNTQDLQRAFKDFDTIMGEGARESALEFTEAIKEARNRQAAFGGFGKKSFKDNKRNYLKGKR